MPAPIGNKNAKKENRMWGDAIRRVVAQGNSEKLRKAAERLVEEAVAGDVAALRELGDRLDGKAVQQIVGEIDANITVEIVRFADQAS